MALLNRNNSPTTNIKTIIINQTFLGDTNTKQIAELAAEQIKAIAQPIASESASMKLLPMGLLESPAGQDDEYKNSINKRIDEAVAFMSLNRLDSARTSLNTLLGEIKTKPGLEKELGRIYNNLGVTYNRPSVDGDYDKAIGFFNLAIANDSSLWKAKMNLAHALLNKGTKEDVTKGNEQAQVLWSIEKNPDTLLVLLVAIRKTDSVEAIFKFLEKEADAVTGLIEDKDNLLCFLAGAYLEQNNYQQALIYIDRALSISPDEPEYLCVKGRALIVRAQNEHSVDSEFDIVPRLNDYNDAQEALVLFERAEDIAKQQNKNYLLPESRYGMVMCQIWLNRFTESLKNLRLIQAENPSETSAHQMDVLNIDIAIKSRDFEAALKTLMQGVGYAKGSYSEKRRVARIFIVNGGLEQAKVLLSDIKVEAEQSQDVYYWFDVSAVCVLLNQKNEAITAATRARKLAEEKDNAELKKAALSHYNAVMFHYTKSDDGEDSETSRFMDGMQDFQKQFPDEHVLVPIQAIDEQGELTDEIKEVFTSAKERFEKIKEVYKAGPFTIYHLEKIFGRGLADIVTGGDPSFSLFFTDVNEDFRKRIDENFLSAKSFIFDYLSLLDLAKMGFLGYLEQLAQPIFVHELLFRKVQEELVLKEIPELRMLWDFLRKNKAVQIVREDSTHAFKNPDTEKLFDSWIVETLRFAGARGAVFVTDDVRLLAFAHSETITSTNVTSFVEHWKESGIIDERMKSRSIGDLAERFYTFLSFTGEDLFEIVLEDKAKITARSYHLVREIFLPGSAPESFIGPFIRFTDLLWKTGALAQEKVQWLRFISNTLIEIIDKEFIALKSESLHNQFAANESLERLKPLTTGLAMIWKIAINNGNADDLRETLVMAEEVLNKEYLQKSKERIVEDIAKAVKKESLARKC